VESTAIAEKSRSQQVLEAYKRHEKQIERVWQQGELLKKNQIAAKRAPTSISPNKNSLSYQGAVHVYVIRGPNGLHKVGESATGVNAVGKSKRAETQIADMRRQDKLGYDSEIRKTFPNKQAARDYETKLIQRYRRMFGPDKLPGNKGVR
jgi:hypothetical protein